MKKLIAAAILLLGSMGAFGQSESFNNPELKKQWMCENETKVVLYILKMKHSGVSKERMLKAEPLPKDWSDERKATVNRIIDQVYATTKTPQVFAREYLDQCMKRSTL